MAKYLTAVIFTLTSGAIAQLLNCAEVPQCPLSNSWSECRIDGRLMTAIGVAEFTSVVAPSPLTWTVTYSKALDVTAVDERRYYLGYPPELDIQALPSASSCALFFTGIEAGLSFVKDGDGQEKGPTSGTCDDALGETCVADLTQQAKDLATSNQNCTILAQMLQATPPTSCTGAGNWGTIAAIPLDKSVPEQLDECRPTSNSTYEMASIALFPEIFPHDYFNDVTPLMTVFMSGNNTGDAAKLSLTEPEVHLNCMKPLNVESTAEFVSTSGSISTTGVAMVLGCSVIMLQSLLWLA